MPDKAFYMALAERYNTPPWQIEKELTLDWYQFIQVWDSERPVKKTK